ncbi:hypothetical protein PC128_g21583 [Phytophthora cactorum]|nr:hypothetical protein PC128_g21583 [Phytophthora cactorum]
MNAYRADKETKFEPKSSHRGKSLLLYELEFHYVVGKKWHILADTAAVVSLRGTYIEYKLSNRRPTRRGKTWLLDDKTRYNKSGKGPRACIVAAGFISSKGGCVEAGFVGGSITYWNSTLKRKSLEDDDYHVCVIHMDGASYHKNQTNRSPTMKWTLDAMRTWLADRHVNFSLKETKTKLMERVTPLKEKPIYMPIELIWATAKGRIARAPKKTPTTLPPRSLQG